MCFLVGGWLFWGSFGGIRYFGKVRSENYGSQLVGKDEFLAAVVVGQIVRLEVVLGVVVVHAGGSVVLDWKMVVIGEVKWFVLWW